jgi:hypothetical protein
VYLKRHNEVSGEWRVLCSEEFCDLYSLYSAVRVIILTPWSRVLEKLNSHSVKEVPTFYGT